MPFTDDFKNILRKNKRNFGIDEGFDKAIEEAGNEGIAPFRDRKKKESRFKKQKGTEIPHIE